MAKASRGSRGRQSVKGEKMRTGTAIRPKGAAPRIDPRIQREIGKHLRAHYDDVVNEPVPDKFIELLRQLERSVEKKS
jgi:Anti-sigma factor NepR